MINQVEAAYEKPDGTSSPRPTPRSRTSTTPSSRPAITDGLSAHLRQWSDDWFAELPDGGFATMLCPGWMLGVIEGNAKDVKGWDIAERLPRRRRQLGRLVPDRSRQSAAPQGGPRSSPPG